MTRTDKEELINHFTWLINNASVRIAGGFSDYEKRLNKHILHVLNDLEAEAKKKKPTLTEDERVILRNIPTKYWQKIRRDNYGVLEINGEEETIDFHRDNISDFDEYNHLFQFIKERRRI